jgi:hypothetical protein
MSGAPYSTVFSPLNPTFINWPLTSFLNSTGTVPTATGYAQYTKIGNFVYLHFKYTFVTVGTGNYSLNLPVPLSATYNRPQSQWYVKYADGKVHEGIYNENTSTRINMVASGTFGAAATAFTSAHPNTGLAAGDIVHGEIMYQID